MEVPAGFREQLEALLQALARDLGREPYPFAVVPGTFAARIDAGVVVLPEAHVSHWRRFGSIPTALVRDIAYAAKKQQLLAQGTPGLSAATDALAYAEVVVRAVLDGETDPQA